VEKVTDDLAGGIIRLLVRAKTLAGFACRRLSPRLRRSNKPPWQIMPATIAVLLNSKEEKHERN